MSYLQSILDFLQVNSEALALLAALIAGSVIALQRLLNFLGSNSIGRESRIYRKELQAQKEELALLREQLAASETNEITQDLLNEIKSQVSGNFVDEVESKIEERLPELLTIQKIQETKENVSIRLADEISNLEKRSNLNLSIGILLAIGGFVLLATLIARTDFATLDEISAFSTLAGRVVLVLLIQLFSFFFLRLYKSTLLEIKYFQNELTTMGFRFLCLEVAIEKLPDSKLQNLLLEAFVSERNFILDKGQSTVSLERERLDIDESRKHLNLIKAVLPGRN